MGIHKRIPFDILVFVLVVAAILFGIFGPLVVNEHKSPPATTYLFAEGFVVDYYQYLSWIRNGINGKLLLFSRYTEEQHPPALVHPLFPLIGFVARPFTDSPVTAYLVARIIITSVFIASLYMLMKNSLTGPAKRAVGLMLLLSITSIWWFVGQELAVGLPWSGSFNVISKFSIPPHHMLAIVLTIGVGFLLAGKSRLRVSLMLTALSAIAVGLLNPSSLILLLIFASVAIALWTLKTKTVHMWLFLHFSVLTGASLPALVYSMLLFAREQPWALWYKLTKAFNPPTSFPEYLFALGPVLLPAAVGTYRTFKTNRFFLWFLSSWAWTPLLLYPLIRYGIIPLNFPRLFQAYQYVPLSVLGAIGIFSIADLLKRVRIPAPITVVIITVSFMLYGLVAYVKTYNSLSALANPYAYNIYIPHAALRAVDFLNRLPAENVVLSGEFVSGFLPALTNHRVILGRDDSAPDYYDKQRKAFDFVDGRMTEAEAKAFLTRYRISYILFGVDTLDFSALKNKDFPFLKEVFRDGSVSVVKVLE